MYSDHAPPPPSRFPRTHERAQSSCPRQRQDDPPVRNRGLRRAVGSVVGACSVEAEGNPGGYVHRPSADRVVLSPRSRTVRCAKRIPQSRRRASQSGSDTEVSGEWKRFLPPSILFTIAHLRRVAGLRRGNYLRKSE